MAQGTSKYDRQLRIWGNQGQLALEKASICLLNCGATGAETLKNLVLAGIGSITIVDAAKVELADLGNNFLVDWDSLGLSRASCVCALLQELNDSVGAKFVEESPEKLLELNPTFFSQFNIVIATQMVESALLKLDGICRRQNVMLLIGRSYGLTGLVRISVKEHCIIESKPDSIVDDLRLHKPWRELKRFADEFDVKIQDSLVHKHIPYAVLLIKAAEDWKQTHGGSLPLTRNERAEFKALVALSRQADDEDNYKEAVSSCYKIWSLPGISMELQQILDDNAAEVHSSSTDFWVMVSALKAFVEEEGEGEPPLDGTIPDMTSLTEYYLNLQKIYQARAEEDVCAVEARVRNILKEIGRDPQSISRLTIKQFCKNARNIRVFRYQALADEFSSKSGLELQKLLAVEENSNPTIYILLRAVDRFAAMYNHYPGDFDGEFEDDVSRLKAIATSVLNEMGGGGTSLSEDLISEMCRFGAAEIHCIASVIGGIVSQETIKLLTRQFTPLSGTFIYNGMDSTSLVLHV